MPELVINLLGRVAAMEFVITQCLAMAIFHLPDKDSFLDDSRRMFRERVDRLPAAAVPHALESFERILSSAMRSATCLPDEK